jgi:DNA-binding NarL/FixJ family response regulator
MSLARVPVGGSGDVERRDACAGGGSAGPAVGRGYRLRIALVDGDALMRALLAQEITRASNGWSVREWGSGAEARQGIGVGATDLLLTEVTLRDGNGAVLASALQERDHRLRVCLLSSVDVLAAVRRSPHAVSHRWSYLVKDSSLATGGLVRAIRAMAQGRCVVDPAVIEASRRRSEGVLTRLSASQLDVLRLVVEGLSNVAVAERLGMTPKGVEYHLRTIYRALGLTDRSANLRVAAVRMFLSEAAATVERPPWSMSVPTIGTTSGIG